MFKCGQAGERCLLHRGGQGEGGGGLHGSAELGGPWRRPWLRAECCRASAESTRAEIAGPRPAAVATLGSVGAAGAATATRRGNMTSQACCACCGVRNSRRAGDVVRCEGAGMLVGGGAGQGQRTRPLCLIAVAIGGVRTSDRRAGGAQAV